MSEKAGYVVLGDSDFIRERIALTISELVKLHGGSPDNTDQIDAGKTPWNRIYDLVTTYSLFGTPRFFILREAEIFLPEEKIDKIVADALESADAGDWDSASRVLVKALSAIDLSETEYADIRTSPSLLKTYLREVTDNTEQVEAIAKRVPLPEKLPEKPAEFDFEHFLGHIPAGHYVIVTAEKWDKRTKTFKIFQKSCQISEKPQEPKKEWEIRRAREQAVDEYLGIRKLSVSREAVLLLKEKAAEAQSLDQCLRKLDLVTYEKNEITEYDINSSFDDDITADILRISDMIKKKDMRGMLSAVGDPLNTKNYYIGLAGYLRKLIKNGITIKEISELAKYQDFQAFETRFFRKNFEILPREMKGAKPYFLYQCYLTFSDFDNARLTRTFLMLFDIDRALKSTQQSPQDLFTDLVIFLFNPRS